MTTHYEPQLWEIFNIWGMLSQQLASVQVFIHLVKIIFQPTLVMKHLPKEQNIAGTFDQMQTENKNEDVNVELCRAAASE